MLTDSNRNSCWGFVIFFLVLAVFLWNGTGLAHNQSCGKQDYIERGVAELKYSTAQQNAVSTAQLETLARAIITNQDKNAFEIMRGQDQQYIRQLEQQNTQLFITAQNDSIKNLIQFNSAAQDSKIQAIANALGHRLDGIECRMLKAPNFVPFGGLAQIGCNNGGFNGWGCNGCNG